MSRLHNFKDRVGTSPLIVFFLIVGVNFSNIFAIQYPINPKDPVIQSDGNKKITTTTTTTKKAIETVAINIKALLQSGDEISGRILVPHEIVFHHTKNGLAYTKKIQPAEIKTIEIKRYAVKNQRKGEGSIFYEFVPDLVIVTLKNNQRFELNSLFDFAQSFNIDTKDGTTRLFSFFGDAYSAKTGWKEVASKDPKYHFTNAHPQSVVKISVLSAFKEEVIAEEE